MNIIVNGFMDQRTAPIIQKVLSDLDIKSFVYTYAYFVPDFGRFNSRATLISWRKINFFGDYGVDQNKLKPLDENIVNSMVKCEVMALKMMDRLESLKDYPYQERKELYLRHLRYWNDLLEKKKIDLFLSSNIPHETADFICYSLCKQKGIPTIILFQTHIPDTTFICDDWESSDFGLKNEFKKLKAKYSSAKLDEIRLGPRFERYYRLQTGLDNNPAPFYMKKKPLAKEGTKKAFSIFKKLKNDPAFYSREWGIIMRAMLRRLTNFVKTKRLMNYYERRCAKFNSKDRYFFLALHLQPEMSTSPRAGAYVEQQLIVQLLSLCAPKGIKIYVKEHPNQQAYTRSYQYYESMLSLSNVRLISRKISSKDLIRNSLAVATCVGLAGFEGLFQGKPLLMFGTDFFQYSPGVFPIESESDLKAAIKNILRGWTFSPEDFKIFLKAVENKTINGTIDSDYMPTSTLEVSENVSNIVSAIINQVKN